jgi:hypothetical protein
LNKATELYLITDELVQEMEFDLDHSLYTSEATESLRFLLHKMVEYKKIYALIYRLGSGLMHEDEFVQKVDELT